ncbi:protein phosphatase Slingshot isoform X2 [Bacillus rossius redtenbacheri]|uniref:protein phosphatase Slingshot isoform X2 n=1 Tax=Bacillus rossius redtenbacheri TaxID=93214 RepID=UPI002FDE614C
MALVTVQRSPSVSSNTSPPTSDSAAEEGDQASRTGRSLSECYFAGKGAAVALPASSRDSVSPGRRVSAPGVDIQHHLQSMFYLLRPEETLKMAVRLESAHAARTRYLVVVSYAGRRDVEESCLLGIDCNERTTVGLVLRLLADTTITLDGDGGFSVSVCGRQHIFKPVSVQAMWSALQTLHKVSSKARELNFFLGGLTHDWVSYYEQRIESDRSCLNEWHAMDSLESRRPPSPDSVRTKPRQREETEQVIRSTLKEIMMSVDLDEVTSKYIRGRLEEDLNMDLGEFKPFIDQEMLTILGQMDAATEVFDHVYLGSEWNASNLEELQRNGVGHILNVTREIDNFFPGMFNYLNIRVYDDEATDLLKHWDDTFKYISQARKQGSKVLVHCKMGVSRSASVVIAYAMKAFSWDLARALAHVRARRSCVKPNSSFVAQLETYQGMLAAMRNRERLQRSKSETDLDAGVAGEAGVREGGGSSSAPDPELLCVDWGLAGRDPPRSGARPKSWSPDTNAPAAPFSVPGPVSVSLEQLNLEAPSPARAGSPSYVKGALPVSFLEARNHTLNVRMPCGNGQAYSVSQNKVVYLPASSVRHRVSELEGRARPDRRGLVLRLTSQYECGEESSTDPGEEVARTVGREPGERLRDASECEGGEEEGPVVSRTKPAPQMLTAVLVKKEIWDPGESNGESVVYSSDTSKQCSGDVTYVSEAKLEPTETVKPRKNGDPFSAQLDRVFDREERRQQRPTIPPPSVAEPSVVEPALPVREAPSRQSSWGSYDSAVVLGDAPSRQSSWGSGDARWGTLPSRNSSWGSYDMRPGMQCVAERGERTVDPLGSSGLFPYDRDEIPWHPGTVKRTKQKLEGGTGTVKRVCPDSQEPSSPSPAEPVHYSSTPVLGGPQWASSEMGNAVNTSASQPNITLIGAGEDACSSPSSPNVISSMQCPSVREQRKAFEDVETVTRDPESPPSSRSPDRSRSTLGRVRNLKKEFEAKSASARPDREKSVSESSDCGEQPKGMKVRSLPSSPVSTHPECRSPGSLEDLASQASPARQRFASESLKTSALRRPGPDTPRPSHVSAVLLCNLRNAEPRRPPVPHVVHGSIMPSRGAVLASVMAKASKKQQQGRTHPLTLLTANNHA